MTTRIISGLFPLFLFAGSAFAQSIHADFNPATDGLVGSWLDANLSELVALYKDLHARPELSWQETQTSQTVSQAFSAAGFEVHSRVGRTGVVGVMRNGSGPTLLIRGDMDALPITEDTGLEYASGVRATRPDGTTVGVMHACGHDIHVTSLIACARLLAHLKDHWSGTLMMVAQPAEELGQGARAMIDDGLFNRFGRPDYCISYHVSDNLPAGWIAYTPGFSFANVDSVDITVFGRGGHGARPHDSIDPVVAAAHLVTALQTLVSRRIDPRAPAVITVGSIHGGSKHNIIPDEVALQLTVRSYSDEVRNQLLDGIRQIAVDTARTFGCPKPPAVIVRDEYTPSVYNDPALTATAADLFRNVFGDSNVIEIPPAMVGEDFSLYMRTLQTPGLMFRVGTAGMETYRASLEPGAPSLPPLHSSRFAPLPEPTLRTGIRATVDLAMALLPSS